MRWLRLYDHYILFRVEIEPSKVTMVCLGTERIDPNEEGEYNSVDDLPNWVQERLAILMMMSIEPPTQFVDGIGRRISDTIYWVFKSDK